MLGIAKKIETTYMSNKTADIIDYVHTVGDKKATITLKITELKNAKGKRVVNSDNPMISVTVVPNYQRPVLEVIPLALITYANDVPSFAAKDSIVVEEQGDGFRFRAGGMLLYNVATFGQLKRGSIGFGIGFAISGQDKQLENLFLGTLLSYGDVLRMGFGIGFAQYPHKLNPPASIGSPLPPDLSDLEELIENNRKLSVFFNLSVAGLSLPVIK